jgi:flagellar biosynthesis chaperone FliJ
MKTRFSSLVAIKKNKMQKSERVLQQANSNLQNASNALGESLEALSEIHTPQEGSMAQFLANRSLLDSQRLLIEHNEAWVAYAQKEVNDAKEQLKRDMIEYEKFKYLELQEIEKVLKAQKIQEAKDLDEVALVTHGKKTKMRQAG